MAVGRDGHRHRPRCRECSDRASRGRASTPRITFDAAKLHRPGHRDRDLARVEPVEASVATDKSSTSGRARSIRPRVVDPDRGRRVDRRAHGRELDAPDEFTRHASGRGIEPSGDDRRGDRRRSRRRRIAADITLVVGTKKAPIDTRSCAPGSASRRTADGGYAPVVDTTKYPTAARRPGEEDRQEGGQRHLPDQWHRSHGRRPARTATRST